MKTAALGPTSNCDLGPQSAWRILLLGVVVFSTLWSRANQPQMFKWSRRSLMRHKAKLRSELFSYVFILACVSLLLKPAMNQIFKNRFSTHKKLCRLFSFSTLSFWLSASLIFFLRHLLSVLFHSEMFIIPSKWRPHLNSNCGALYIHNILITELVGLKSNRRRIDHDHLVIPWTHVLFHVLWRVQAPSLGSRKQLWHGLAYQSVMAGHNKKHI